MKSEFLVSLVVKQFVVKIVVLEVYRSLKLDLFFVKTCHIHLFVRRDQRKFFRT